MKVACDRSTLTRGVQVASSVVLPRSPKPALGCIKLEAQAGKMTLLATDLEVGIRIELDKIDVQQPGEAWCRPTGCTPSFGNSTPTPWP